MKKGFNFLKPFLVAAPPARESTYEVQCITSKTVKISVKPSIFFIFFYSYYRRKNNDYSGIDIVAVVTKIALSPSDVVDG